uniref:Uncharacterized protein n=1 Tax=Isometrus maculatus TaxID=497827 RepID=A0A0U1SF19_ISOMC|nr:hypothetical protein [Isometrus maculatus]
MAQYKWHSCLQKKLANGLQSAAFQCRKNEQKKIAVVGGCWKPNGNNLTSSLDKFLMEMAVGVVRIRDILLIRSLSLSRRPMSAL